MKSRKSSKDNLSKEKCLLDLSHEKDEHEDNSSVTNDEIIMNNAIMMNICSATFTDFNNDTKNNNHDFQKSKRKVNGCDNDPTVEKLSKISKKNLTPETFSSNELLTPCTSVSLNDVFIPDTFNVNNCDTNDLGKKDYFSLLPDEVLLIIFKNFTKQILINCACVCRRWRSIAFDNDLWPRIDLSQQKLQPGIMTHVLMRGPQILRMAQTQVSTPIFKNMKQTMENYVNKVEYLDLSMASILPPDLELLLRTCRSLQKLSLENCEINENVCNEIAKNSKLSVLNMSQCVGLNELGLKMILVNCRKLLELNIAWTSLNKSIITCVNQFIPKDILRLNISGCKEMTDSYVSALVLRCNKMKEIDLSDATGISENVIQAICDNLLSLEILSLSRCYNIFPAAYTKLCMLPALKHLNIFGLFQETHIELLRTVSPVKINTMKFSNIARPTVGIKRTSIWGLRVRD